MSEINSATLKVSKLEATEDHFDLYELFKEFGNIFSCKVSKKYSKGENNVILSESNKYGYVTYETEDEAKAAYEHYKSNQVIKVELFKEDASISG
jgi:RNA recognition motif-containing protein